MKVLASNKKSAHNFAISDKIEAGLVLQGNEVKSIKTGHISLKGAYVNVVGEQAFLIGAHVPNYKYSAAKDYDPERTRKLLLHKSEIRKLIGQKNVKGQTLVPIEVYEKRGKIKLMIGVGRGTKKFEKRDKIKKQETEREVARELRGREKQ